jgi:hypothetical protein
VADCWLLRASGHTSLGVVVGIHYRVLGTHSHALPGIGIGPGNISLRIPGTSGHASSANSIAPGSRTSCGANLVCEVCEHVGRGWTVDRVDTGIGCWISYSVGVTVCGSHAGHCLVVSVQAH